MSHRLNLAALTAQELQLLLGEAAAQRLLPEISGARLAGRAYPGHTLPRELTFEPQDERDWGSTLEVSRLLRAARSELAALEAEELGVFYVPGLPEVRHQRAYLMAPDTALALRWAETPELDTPTPPPFLSAVTLMRDRASGTAAVFSSTAALPFTPTQSEEIDARQYDGASAAELLQAHRTQVNRHGRGAKLNTVNDWQRAFQTVRGLNIAAWTRRGLLVNPS